MLILLIFIIKIYGAIIQKAQNAGKKSKEKKAETVAETPAPVVAAPVAPAQTDGVSDEVVAVISAAVATMYGSSEKARIKSIKSHQTAVVPHGQKPVYLIIPARFKAKF